MGKTKRGKEFNCFSYTFHTLPPTGSSAFIDQLELSGESPDSRVVSVAVPDSAITRNIKRSQASREDFGRSSSTLTQVEARLSQLNEEQAQRAELLMSEIDEVRND